MVGAAECAEAAGHTADLHAVRMTQEGELNGHRGQGVEHVSAGELSVGHLIGIMTKIRSLRVKAIMGSRHIVIAVTGMQGRVRANHAAILVKGEHDLLRRTALCADKAKL